MLTPLLGCVYEIFGFRLFMNCSYTFPFGEIDNWTGSCGDSAGAAPGAVVRWPCAGKILIVLCKSPANWQSVLEAFGRGAGGPAVVALR